MHDALARILAGYAWEQGNPVLKLLGVVQQ